MFLVFNLRNKVQGKHPTCFLLVCLTAVPPCNRCHWCDNCSDIRIVNTMLNTSPLYPEDLPYQEYHSILLSGPSVFIQFLLWLVFQIQILPSSLCPQHFMWNPNPSVRSLCTDVSLTSVCYMSFYRCLGFTFNGSPGSICIRWRIGQHSQWANEVWHRPVWEWRGSGQVQRRGGCVEQRGKVHSCRWWRLREVWRCVRFGSLHWLFSV